MAVKKPAAKPVAARKQKAATKAGYTGPKAVQAQASATRQYGLVKDAKGNWVKPDMAFMGRQLTSMGYGASQPVTNTVAIGGARWETGAGVDARYTGERARVDADAGGPGTETEWATKTKPGYMTKAGKDTTKKRTQNRKNGGKRVGGGAAVETQYTEGSYEAAPSTTVEPVYAEADITRTGYGAAQGKGYGKGQGSSYRGVTGGGSVIPGETPVGEAPQYGKAPGKGKSRPKKHGPKNKRVYQKVKATKKKAPPKRATAKRK